MNKIYKRKLRAIETKETKPTTYNGKVSDGYHTFDELYDHRMILFSCIINSAPPSLVWKSKYHDDGTMYGNYFIVGMNTAFGQTTYHYPLKHWSKFDCKELMYAPSYDGHTPEDVLCRLYSHHNGIGRINYINANHIADGWIYRTEKEKRNVINRLGILIAGLSALALLQYFL